LQHDTHEELERVKAEHTMEKAKHEKKLVAHKAEVNDLRRKLKQGKAGSRASCLSKLF
jgi:SMC interacting uncharacterized protein involved in chromosome segregation